MNNPTDSNYDEDLLEYFLEQVTVSCFADELIISSLIEEEEDKVSYYKRLKEDSICPILSTPNEEEGFFWKMINRNKTK
jgi:hypothetical protein